MKVRTSQNAAGEKEGRAATVEVKIKEGTRLASSDIACAVGCAFDSVADATVSRETAPREQVAAVETAPSRSVFENTVSESGGRTVDERQSEVGDLRLRYTLLCEDGTSRTAFDSPCACFYTLTVTATSDTGTETVRLTDIARSEARARAILALFADGQVTPTTAREVADALLA